MKEIIIIYYNSISGNYEITQQDLQIKAGNNYNILLLIYDENDIAVNLTDAIILFTAKQNSDDTDAEAIIKKDVIANDNIVNSIYYKITINPEDTEDESGIDLPNNLLYDIKIKDKDDNIFTIAEGVIAISQGITQRSEFETG